ncbi:MAG: CapA family protein [Bacteroidota bacterium]
MNVLFTGDLCFSGSFAQRLEEGMAIFSEELEELFRQQVYCIGNLEGPLVAPALAQKHRAKIINPPACLPYLMSLNAKVFTLANNHTFDCGKEGFLQTREQLAESQARWFGAGESWGEASKPLILSHEEHTVALLGISFREGMLAGPNKAGVFSTQNIHVITGLIQEARKKADTVIICYHGEEEYTQFPMPSRRKWLHQLAEQGVDAIVCHHPHVLQGIEYVQGVPICYSLGNTVFDVAGHRHRSFTDMGGLLQMQIENGNIHIRLIPIRLDRDKGLVAVLQSQKSLTDLADIHDFSQYQRRWEEEAFRVFQERHFSAAPFPPSPTAPPVGKWKRMAKKLGRRSFYKTLFATLYYPNSRAIFVAAIRYQIRKTFSGRP